MAFSSYALKPKPFISRENVPILGLPSPSKYSRVFFLEQSLEPTMEPQSYSPSRSGHYKKLPTHKNTCAFFIIEYLGRLGGWNAPNKSGAYA